MLILAAKTKRVKIVLLGNPVATVGNQLRLAEELAMIDLISGGRSVPGWVRGAGSEQFANNTNPAQTASCLRRASILSSRRGRHRARSGMRANGSISDTSILGCCHSRSRIRRSGFRALISPDTAQWCAKRRYPYVALATKLEPTLELWHFYGEAAAREGYQAGPENFGYLQPVMVADNQQRARS